jgi:hypothetical protein
LVVPTSYDFHNQWNWARFKPAHDFVIDAPESNLGQTLASQLSRLSRDGPIGRLTRLDAIFRRDSRRYGRPAAADRHPADRRRRGVANVAGRLPEVTARPIVPPTFAAPPGYATDVFRLELLGPQHNEADHAAWMSSIDHIRDTPGFGRGWPPPGGMTLAENRADLESHMRRSAAGTDFAYTVIEIATGDIMGCVYIHPKRGKVDPEHGGDEVEASSWVTGARAELDEPLTVAVGSWLATAWPFEEVHYRRGRQPTVIHRTAA